MRKVLFQTLVIASLLGMSAASATAIPQVDVTNNGRHGQSGSVGVEQQAAMAPASSNRGASRAPNNRPDSPGNFSIDFGSQRGGK